ncbi:MAG: hypothetical protein HY841_02810, partial [Bacteroidetes bacterium]|nr:hypothetical protein [Bacteroidota bacterium]
MKNNLQLIFILFAVRGFLPPVSCAQIPSWAWAKQAGTNMNVEAFSVTADASGNSYVMGMFAGTSITFGSTTLNALVGSTVTGDIFLVKYNAIGGVVWAKNAGGKDWDQGESVASDGFGNLYMAGWYWSDTIIFGSDTLINAGVSGYPIGTTDMFIAKYDTAGNILWAKRAGGTLGDSALSVTADAFGNVYVVGSFKSSSITFGSTTLTNAGGNYAMFIVKYDANGNVLWAKSAGGNNPDCPASVSSDASGNVYVAGTFRSSSITFGSTTLTNTNSGWAEIFIVKYDASGNALWAKSASGITGDYATSVSCDAFGNVYMAGYSYSSSITFASITLPHINASDIFIVKYDTLGNVLWAQRAGGGGNNDAAWSMVVDNSGNIYLTGEFSSNTIIFGSTILSSPNNSADIFVVKYDSSGSVIWAIRVGGNDADIPKSIVADASGYVYVAGYFESPSISFDATTLSTSAQIHKMFIAKLGIVTGVNEFINKEEINIYPNPTGGVFNLKMGQFENLKMKSIEIYNVYGEKIFYNNHF